MVNLNDSISTLPPLKIDGARREWVDIAKAISITLVVAWHVIGRTNLINEALIFVRMPLFFFLAGLFVRGSFNQSWGDLLVMRISNFLYLFFLWSMITHFVTEGGMALADGRALALSPVYTIFLVPPLTLWFIYALAFAMLIAMVVRRLPLWVVLAASLILYAWSVSDGSWLDVIFYERVVRLLPFFILGLCAFETLETLVDRWRLFWPLPLALFIIVGLYVYTSNLKQIALVTFPLSLLGIIAVSLVARFLQDTRFAGVLLFIGGSSLYIYVMHRLPLFYIHAATNRLAPDFVKTSPVGLAVGLATVAVIVTGCAVVGRILNAHRISAHLFRAPWSRPRQAAGAIGQARTVV